MSLFDSLDEAKRQRLRALGWTDEGQSLRRLRLWRRPEDGALLEESEAFTQLARLEAEAARVKGIYAQDRED